MAASGIGVTLLSSYPAEYLLYPNLVARPLVAPQVFRSVYAVTRKGRPLPLADERFLELLEESLAARRR